MKPRQGAGGDEGPLAPARLAPAHLSACLQDGRADVVANDAGDRVTPAVVAFSESEEVRSPCRGRVESGGALPAAHFPPFILHPGCWISCKAKQNKKHFKHCSESKADPWAKVREQVRGKVRSLVFPVKSGQWKVVSVPILKAF